jgi:heme exporter protein D
LHAGGLALISYLGNFPEKAEGAGNLGLLNFEWSALIIGVLSVVVYVIANKVARPTEVVLENIEQSKQEAALEDAELGEAP